MTMTDVRHLLAVLPNWVRRHPDDEWAADFAEHVPPLLDELDAARAALAGALGGEGAQPLGGLAAGIRKLAEQRQVAEVEAWVRDVAYAEDDFVLVEAPGSDPAVPVKRLLDAIHPDWRRVFNAASASRWDAQPAGWDAGVGPTGSVGD